MPRSSTPSGLPVADRPYTHEMVVVHRVFRRESALLPRMVRAVPDGESARAAQVSAYLTDYVLGLHHHHTLEDELIWPLLRARADDAEELVARMEEQHGRIDSTLEAVALWAPQWQRSADSVAGQELALALDEHRLALLDHLDDEERLVLPLVAEHLTVDEWDLVGRRGLENLPKDKVMFAIGAILEDATEDERAYFLGKAPLLGRLVWKLVGRRQYAAACHALRAPLSGEAGR
ncbi:hemerythrin domain-containing protein [Streptomyces neyagawaensis]|uniref:hemerythrin domain-containing protein n=1 Tax=Streptomyces neyagawaensis TaxID=42238 RepID=UPI000A8041F4|nr:hemerythrin domain-containing protein [Streptomyces neyagawaensis]MCL6733222.1 hemerythrin domain-containing protein [Streptomyces neyagawaensis]MDE1685024.1 hemerythrin domain-containing protein [Streptomyces neyagawaensis]